MTGPRPLVLFRTAYFDASPLDQVAGLAEKEHFSFDQQRLREADVVVFHIPELAWGDYADTPKYPGQLWAAWSLESNVNYPKLASPSFLSAFDIGMTYEQSSDVWVPYLPDLPLWRRAMGSSIPAKTASSPLVMFQSSKINQSRRYEFAAELMRHIAVDSFGRYLNNKSLSEEDRGYDTKRKVIADYPFCLALENSIAPDYVTEKLFDCFLAGVVPVYLGAPNVAEFAPAGSHILADAFASPRALAEHLRHLLSHPDQYARFFAWRDAPLPEGLAARIEAASRSPFLRLIDVATAKLAQRAPVADGAPSFPLRPLA